MPDIKTKDVVLGTIKTVDRSALAGQRMKDAYVHARSKAEQSVSSSESNSEEYAANRISEATADIAREAVHQVDTLGQRIVQRIRHRTNTLMTRPAKIIALQKRMDFFIQCDIVCGIVGLYAGFFRLHMKCNRFTNQ